jgi:feruloyl esterase
MRFLTAGICVLFLAAVVPDRTLHAGSSCASLSTLSLPNATITMAQALEAGPFTPPGQDTAAESPRTLPAFCRVAATLKPTADSDIKIEVWMPAAGWNGKYQAVGNGAFNGSIAYPAMMTALTRGYATSSTDTGHTGNNARFAPGHPEKVIDTGVDQSAFSCSAIPPGPFGASTSRSTPRAPRTWTPGRSMHWTRT